MKRVTTAAVAAAILVASALPSTARAYEDQYSLDVGVGPSFILVDSALPAFGLPRLAAGMTFGIGDEFAVRADLAWAFHPAIQPMEQDLHFLFIGVEGLYVVDLLQVVPFIGVGIDVLPSFQSNTVFFDFAAHVVVGIDYLPERNVAIGVDLRPYVLFTDFDLKPVYLTVNFRVSFLFDY